MMAEILVVLLPLSVLKILMKNKRILSKIIPKKIKMSKLGPQEPDGKILIASKITRAAVK
jgi:hypothetical protein